MAPSYRPGRRKVAVAAAVIAAVYTLLFTRKPQGPKTTTSLNSIAIERSILHGSWIKIHVDGVLGFIAVFVGVHGGKNWVRNSCFSRKGGHNEVLRHCGCLWNPRLDGATQILYSYDLTTKSWLDAVYFQPHAGTFYGLLILQPYLWYETAAGQTAQSWENLALSPLILVLI